MTLQRHRVHFCVATGTLAWVVMLGCRLGPARVQPPRIDPESAAREAVELYDSDGDGEIGGGELDACPGLRVSLAVYDQDKNAAISADEIAERLAELTKYKTALAPLQIIVRRKGQPLANANVQMIPEAYLGDQVKPASGTTGPAGAAPMCIADEDLPAAQQGLPGVHYGTFRVEITHPDLAIPEHYNVRTTLGYETRRGDPLAEFDID